MPMTHECEYLSFGDSLFLYLEHDGAPLNIASLAIFDGEISATELRNLVASKLGQIPRYMQRVVVPPLNVGMPYWEFATDFTLERHIREIRLKRGTAAELKDVTANVLSPNMDRGHPLWDLTLIRSLKGNRTAMIARVHHCLADGISGMGLINVLMETSPTVPVFTRPKVHVRRRAINGNGTDTLNSAIQSWFSTLERLLQAGTGVLTMFQRATGISEDRTAEAEAATNNLRKLGQDQIVRVATELMELPQRLPFNVLCRGPQRFEWTEARLEDLKALRSKCGATVNDAILTVLTAAFRRYTELQGVNPRGRSIRIVVPMSTRRHQSDGLGNHITFAPFSAPLGIRTPKKLLSAIHQRMEFVKTARIAEFVSFAGTLLGTIPTPLQAMLAPIISELPISVCNTICTNVPGPKHPLYLLGHEMLNAYPYVPIGGEMGINCAVLSYNGTVYFGFTGDVNAAPNLEKLPRFVDQSVAELLRAAGIRRRAVRKVNAPNIPITLPSVEAQTQPIAPQPEPRPMARIASAGVA